MKKTLYPVRESVSARAGGKRACGGESRSWRSAGWRSRCSMVTGRTAITEVMWEPIKNPDYVADPAKGSRHNRGAAVDLTLIDRKTGVELAMPTPYDDFTPRARHDFNDLPAVVIANRALLRDIMVKHGFEPLPSEWWHYDFKGWERFELMDVSLKALEAHEARQPVPIPW